MCRVAPQRDPVASDAKGGVNGVRHQKLAEAVVMRIVTRRALSLSGVVELHLARQGCRIREARVPCDEVLIVNKGNRMIVGEVGAEDGDSREAAERSVRTLARCTESNRSIVARETKPRAARRLLELGLGRTALVKLVALGREVATPQASRRRAAVRSMAKSAHARDRTRTANLAWARRAQIMDGVLDAGQDW